MQSFFDSFPPLLPHSSFRMHVPPVISCMFGSLLPILSTVSFLRFIAFSVPLIRPRPMHHLSAHSFPRPSKYNPFPLSSVYLCISLFIRFPAGLRAVQSPNHPLNQALTFLFQLLVHFSVYYSAHSILHQPYSFGYPLTHQSFHHSDIFRQAASFKT